MVLAGDMLIKIHHLAGQFSLTLRYNRPNITLGDDFKASVARRASGVAFF